jgi:hypothetical protein
MCKTLSDSICKITGLQIGKLYDYSFGEINVGPVLILGFEYRDSYWFGEPVINVDVEMLVVRTNKKAKLQLRQDYDPSFFVFKEMKEEG